MLQNWQFGLKGLLSLILAVAVILGAVQVSGRIWLFALPIIGCLLAVCLIMLRSCQLGTRRIHVMLAAVSLPAIWLIWRALFPGMYYMGADGFFTVIYWLGVAAVAFWGAAYSPANPGSDADPQPSCPRQQRLFLGIPMAVTLMIVLRVPLLLGFLTARPGLATLAERARPMNASVTLRPPWNAD